MKSLKGDSVLSSWPCQQRWRRAHHFTVRHRNTATKRYLAQSTLPPPPKNRIPRKYCLAGFSRGTDRYYRCTDCRCYHSLVEPLPLRRRGTTKSRERSIQVPVPEKKERSKGPYTALQACALPLDSTIQIHIPKKLPQLVDRLLPLSRNPTWRTSANRESSAAQSFSLAQGCLVPSAALSVIFQGVCSIALLLCRLAPFT